MEWISVKDRLPENGVLVEVLYGRRRVVEKLERRDNLWFTEDGHLYIFKSPTYWLDENAPAPSGKND